MTVPEETTTGEITIGETTIDLLRHGEPVGGSRYRGQLDYKLSEKGWQQMWSAVEGRQDWQQIVTSPLCRCREFAAALGDQLAIPVQIESCFIEVGFGEWEGKTRAEIDEQLPGQLARFYENPERHRPAGAEPLGEFVTRVQQGLGRVIEQFPGQGVLLVAHAGVIRAILSAVLEIPAAHMYRIHVENAGLSRFRTNCERGFKFISHGQR